MTILVDSSLLIGLALKRDHYHDSAVALIRQLPQDDLLVVMPSLFELFFVCHERVGYAVAVAAYAAAYRRFHIEFLMTEDLSRIESIMQKYQDAQFDPTDAAIMAVSERLEIRQIATFDRRDFSIFRPSHTDYLELLP